MSNIIQNIASNQFLVVKNPLQPRQELYISAADLNNDILSQDIIDALEAANNPSSTNAFATINDLTATVITDLDPVINQQNTPPGGPSIGDRYLVDTVPTGAWVGNANSVAEWDGLAWVYTVPVLDNVVYVTNTLTTLRWNGSAWVSYPGTAILNYGNSVTSPLRVGTKTNQLVYLIVNNTPVGRLGNASNGFLNDTYIGSLLTAPSARLHVRGSNTSSATKALLVQNANPTSMFSIQNDGSVWTNGGAGNNGGFEIHQVSGLNLIMDIYNASYSRRHFTIFDNGGATAGDSYVSIGGRAADFAVATFYPAANANYGSLHLNSSGGNSYQLFSNRAGASYNHVAFINGSGGGLTLVQNASQYYELQLQSFTGIGTNILLSSDSTSYLSNISTAQLGIGVVSPDASAKVQIDSTTMGFAPPRMTTVQRTAINGGTPGVPIIVFDTDLNQFYGWNNSSWVILG